MNLGLLAAELTVEKLTDEKLTHLKVGQKEYVKGVNGGEFEGMVPKNEAFQRTFCQMTENRFLPEHLEKLTNVIFAIRYNTYFLLGIAQRTVSEHEAMIRALEKKDVKDAPYPKGKYYLPQNDLSFEKNESHVYRSFGKGREWSPGREPGKTNRKSPNSFAGAASKPV